MILVFFSEIVNTLSLHPLLDSDKLTKPNFNRWYRKLKIILKHERILYVITDPAPEESVANTHDTVRDTYQKWLNDSTMVHCIMRAAMNDELSHQFEDAQSNKMIQKLNKSFDTPEDAERYKTSCAIFNARTREGASVIDHVLYMIEKI